MKTSAKHFGLALRP